MSTGVLPHCWETFLTIETMGWWSKEKVFSSQVRNILILCGARKTLYCCLWWQRRCLNWRSNLSQIGMVTGCAPNSCSSMYFCNIWKTLNWLRVQSFQAKYTHQHTQRFSTSMRKEKMWILMNSMLTTIEFRFHEMHPSVSKRFKRVALSSYVFVLLCNLDSQKI